MTNKEWNEMKARMEQMIKDARTKQQEPEKIDGLRYTVRPKGISVFSDQMVTITGEQKVKLEDGRIIDQYTYIIDGYTPENGKEFAALKANIVVLD